MVSAPRGPKPRSLNGVWSKSVTRYFVFEGIWAVAPSTSSSTRGAARLTRRISRFFRRCFMKGDSNRKRKNNDSCWCGCPAPRSGPSAGTRTDPGTNVPRHTGNTGRMARRSPGVEPDAWFDVRVRGIVQPRSVRMMTRQHESHHEKRHPPPPAIRVKTFPRVASGVPLDTVFRARWKIDGKTPVHRASSLPCFDPLLAPAGHDEKNAHRVEVARLVAHDRSRSHVCFEDLTPVPRPRHSLHRATDSARLRTEFALGAHNCLLTP